jgi:hypothetical protein
MLTGHCCQDTEVNENAVISVFQNFQYRTPSGTSDGENQSKTNQDRVGDNRQERRRSLEEAMSRAMESGTTITKEVIITMMSWFPQKLASPIDHVRTVRYL